MRVKNTLVKHTVFLTLIFTAIALPVMVSLVKNGQYKVTGRAVEANTLRAWFEPAEVVMKPGVQAELKLVVERAGSGTLAWSELRIEADAGLAVEPDKLQLPEGFSGRITVGRVKVTASKPGRHEVRITAEKVGGEAPVVLLASPGVLTIK